jgi:DNA-binding NarL/FixJ family response regulator
MSDIRVLIVDDQEPYRLAMTAVVDETDGFVVAGWAHSGEESVAAAERLHPDLVLMDVNLPAMDGIEATRLLRDLDRPPIVLLLSTYDEDDFDTRGSGAASYVAKAALSPDRLTSAWAEANEPQPPATTPTARPQPES